MGGAQVSEIYYEKERKADALSLVSDIDQESNYGSHMVENRELNRPRLPARRVLNFDSGVLPSGDYSEVGVASEIQPQGSDQVFESFKNLNVKCESSSVDDQNQFVPNQIKGIPTLQKCDYSQNLQYSDSSFDYQYFTNARQLHPSDLDYIGNGYGELSGRPSDGGFSLPFNEVNTTFFHSQNFNPLMERGDILNHQPMAPPMHGLRRSFSSIPEDRPDCFCPPRDPLPPVRPMKISPRAHVESPFQLEPGGERFPRGIQNDPCFDNFSSHGMGFPHPQQPPFIKPHMGQPMLSLASPTRTQAHGMYMDHYCRDLSSPLMNSSLPTTPKTPLDGGNPSVLSSPSSAQNINTALYKTELCRSWEETGTCRYGVKCQFAHGKEELRPVARHPKYKTEICRTFSTNGTCPYGKRCRFIHKTSLSDGGEIVKRTLSEDISMLMRSEKKCSNTEPTHGLTTEEKGLSAPNSTPSTPRRRLKIFTENACGVDAKVGDVVSKKQGDAGEFDAIDEI